MKRTVVILALTLGLPAAQAERINQEGRLLGNPPVVTSVLLFNTTNADAVVAAMQIFPVTNPWNEDISRRPLLANSDAMIARISSDLQSSRRTLRAFKEMNFVLVPDSQPTVPINFVDYPDESDLDGGTFPTGLYPIPGNLPVETWPSETEGQTLSEWQQDLNDWGGDRHAIIVKPGARLHLGNLAGQTGQRQLGGVQRGKVQPELQRPAPRGLDFRRRRRSADVPGAGALRRM